MGTCWHARCHYGLDVLVGRGPEAERLTALLALPRGIAAAVGPAGVGKTTLVREVVAADAVWVRGFATGRDRSGAGLRDVLPKITGDPELDASNTVRSLGLRLLVVDDAQWADPHTRTVVELVATMRRVIATWRSGDPAAMDTPPAHWDILKLEGLGAGDARAFAKRLHPTLADPDLQALLEVADGSPLLIEQLVSSNSSSPTLVSALLARLQNLPSTVRQAAVLIAAAESGLMATGVPDHMAEPLRQSGLVVFRDDRWWPRHALLQECLLEVAEPCELRNAHTVLSDLYADNDPAIAARHALRAGRNDRSLELANLNLARAADPVDRARAMLVLADTVELQDPDAAWELRIDATSRLREEARYTDVLLALQNRPCPTGNLDHHAIAHYNLAAAHWERGDLRNAADHIERALQLMEGSDSEAALLAHAGMAFHASRVLLDGAASLDHAQTAVHLAERHGQHIAASFAALAGALLTSGHPGWRAAGDHAVAEACARNDFAGERLARECRYVHTLVSGDLETASADLDVLTGERMLRGRPVKSGHLAFRLLLDLLNLGDPATIVESVQQLLADRPVLAQHGVVLAVGVAAAVGAGRPEVAQQMLVTFRPEHEEEQLWMAWADAELAWGIGREVVLPSRRELRVTLHPATAPASVAATWAAFEAGRPLPDPPRLGLPGLAPAVAEVLAIHQLAQGATAAAVEAFDEIAARWLRGTDRRGALRCAWGAALAADGASAPDALERMRQCWRLATDHRYAPVATRAALALRRRGIQTRPFPTPACAPLSSPQTQVLRLVAAGFTFDEVAKVLGVETGTVSDHLSASIDRLHMSSRAEAVRWIVSRS